MSGRAIRDSASGLLRARIAKGECADHRLYYHREPTNAQVRALLETAGFSQ